jgi:hypothetical protein
MFIAHPRDGLVVAHERGRQPHAQAAAERMRSPSTSRRALAVSLRRAADRLDPVPLACQPARPFAPSTSRLGGAR